MTLAELDRLLTYLARALWADRDSAIAADGEDRAYRALLDLPGLTTTSLRRALAREVVWRAMHLPGEAP